MSKEDVFSKVLKWHLITPVQIKDGADSMFCIYIVFTLLLVGLCSITSNKLIPLQTSVFACVALVSIVPILILYLSFCKKISKHPSMAYLFMGIAALFLGIIALFASCIITITFRAKISIIIILSLSITSSFLTLIYKQWFYKHGWKKEKALKTRTTVLGNPFIYAWVLVCFARGFNKNSLILFVCSMSMLIFLLLGIISLHNYYVAQKHQIDLDYESLRKKHF